MPQVITTILLDDNPKGLRLIEMANWSGKAFVVPRGKLKNFREREDSQQPGLYFLFGEGSEKPTLYIGQSENVLERLLSHDSNREEDEWNSALVFTGNLDSTFIKFLECNLLDLAKKADRYVIFNTAIPRENRLSEAQKISASDYLNRIRLITGLFGYLVFEDLKEAIKEDSLYLFEDVRNKDGSGKGKLLPTGEFLVFAGSLARIKQTESFRGSGPRLVKKLLEEGVLKKFNENSYTLTKDYIFSSPSAASDTIAARGTNGWVCWKDKNGKTLDENVRK